MRVALIVPTRHLDDAPETNYQMVLPQQCQNDPTYAQWYAWYSGYKILDNGAAEGESVSFQDLLDIAYFVGAAEIVCPDMMGHMEGTLQMSKQFLDYVRNNRPQAFADFKFGLVLQGKSMDEVLKCYNAFGYYKAFEECSVCYVPRILANNIHKDLRVNFMEAVDAGRVDRHFEEFHALGATRHMKEVVNLAETSIRGVDSSQPAVLAQYGISLKQDATSRSRKANFFEAELDTDLLQENLDLYLSWCS